MKNSKNCVVNDKYCYKVNNHKVRKGSVVILSTPQWLSDVCGPTWEGTVTSIKNNSNDDSNFEEILRVKKY